MEKAIQELRSILEQRRGQKEYIKTEIIKSKKEIDQFKHDLEISEKARIIIQTMAQATQQELEYHITEIVNLAQSAVFDDPYDLSIKFVSKRGKTEAELSFIRDGNKFDPISDTGGGAIDIGAFALRVALWYIGKPRSRNVFILDEPFIRLKGIANNLRALQMIHTISHELNLQIIMVSDERVPLPDICQLSDKVFNVTKKGKISSVQILDMEKSNDNYKSNN